MVGKNSKHIKNTQSTQNGDVSTQINDKCFKKRLKVLDASFLRRSSLIEKNIRLKTTH